MIARGYDRNTVTEIDSSTVGRNGEKHKSLRVIANNYDCNTMTNADVLQSVEMDENVYYSQ